MSVLVPAVFEFHIFSSNVTQPYLQSAETLMRNVFIKPPPELCLKLNKLLQLLKPLYGLSDSDDYWGPTFRYHIVENLGMQCTLSDAALFFERVKSELFGLASYVDDTLHTQSKEYIGLTKETEKQLQFKSKE